MLVLSLLSPSLSLSPSLTHPPQAMLPFLWMLSLTVLVLLWRRIVSFVVSSVVPSAASRPTGSRRVETFTRKLRRSSPSRME